MGTKKIAHRKGHPARGALRSGSMPPSNKQIRAVEERLQVAVEERLQVIEGYIASLRNFMKSISRKWN